MTSNTKTCLVVGGRGYLGSELMRHLRNAGWKVCATARHPRETGDIAYSLGDVLPPGALENVGAVVHCGYDFGPIARERIQEINVRGTEHLLRQLSAAGITNIISISSISAFPGCRSLYGKAKLQIENATMAAGGVALRPGLIYGGSNQAMFGRLLAQVGRGKPIPLLTGSPCTQFLVHVDDLCHLIESVISDKIARPTSVWTVAHPEPWPLRKLLTAMAGSKKLRFIPVPWQPVWLALRMAEMLGIATTFKSDSVRSIVYQNLHPDLSDVPRSGIDLRGFDPSAV